MRPLKLSWSCGAAIDFAILFVSIPIPAPDFRPRPRKILAGAEGFEPPSPVLETGSLTVELTPLNPSGPGQLRPRSTRPDRPCGNCRFPDSAKLFHFLMRRVLAAAPAKL